MRVLGCLLLAVLPCAAAAVPLTKPDKVIPVHKATVYPDSAVVSPDGRQLAFASRAAKQTSLIVVDLGTLAAKSYPLPVNSPSELRFEEGWKALWFASDKEIYRFVLAEKQAKKWRTMDTEVNGLTVAKGKVYVTVRLTLGRKELTGKIPRGVTSVDLHKVCAVPEQGAPKPLTRDFVSDGKQPVLTKSGEIILDASYPNKEGQLNEREITLLTLEGKRTRLTQVRGNCYAPNVSADGKLVAFSCTNGEKENFLGLLALATKKPKLTRLVEDKEMSASGTPFFSPDNATIAIAVNKGDWLGYLIAAKGGPLVQFTDTAETSVVGFAREGKAVVFEVKQRLYLATWK